MAIIYSKSSTEGSDPSETMRGLMWLDWLPSWAKAEGRLSGLLQD